MTDMNDDTEEMEIDPDHPWVFASTVMDPNPVPIHAKFQGMMIEVQGKVQPAAQLEVVTPVGAFTFFFPPQMLQVLLQQGSQVFAAMQKHQQQGLMVVPNMEQVKNVEDLLKRMNGHGEG